MPIPHGSPDSVSYAGTIPAMTPRTPRSPDDTRSVLGTGGFPHMKSRLATRAEKAIQSGAMKRIGRPFNLPIEDKDQLKDLLKLAQTHGQVSLGSLESLRSFSRSGDTPPSIPDHTTVIREKSRMHYEGIHQAAVALSHKERANVYIDLLLAEEPVPFSGASHTESRGKSPPTASDATANTSDIDLRPWNGDSKKRKKDAEKAAQAEARRLDQIPATYAAWKKLDEDRQVKVARFLQLADGQKDSNLANRNWNRDDAMALHMEYLAQPEFKSEVSQLLARRMTTDPRRRPTVSSTPNPHS
ncbi:unnamed protein product [Rhizoctonia solani]|uniref:Uncharacterized protein n=1 Tax=Rhizoctonia solani TaxID=456999 RepID=A0A8H3I565_9AGAM|nr:unnamed protein product [Rhizoctonia solani]